MQKIITVPCASKFAIHKSKWWKRTETIEARLFNVASYSISWTLIRTMVNAFRHMPSSPVLFKEERGMQS